MAESKPWEKYKSEGAKPWEKYGSASVSAEKPQEAGLLGKSLDVAARVLDYPGGLIRTGGAAAWGALQGENPVTREDVSQMVRGKAPTSAEYFERLGVEPGPSSYIPGVGEVSTRDVLGFGMDVATDPLTLVSKGIRALRPAETALESGGRSMYKSGLKKVDERLAEKNVKPVSDILLEEGKAGTTQKLSQEAAKLGQKFAKQREELYRVANEKGVVIDTSEIVKNAQAQIANLRKDPGLRPMADRLDDLVKRYQSEGFIDITTASDWKSNLTNALPESAFDPNGKLKGPAAQVEKALAQDFRKAIIDAGNKAEPGLGNKIDDINQKWSSVLEARKPFRMQVRREITPNALTSVDAMLGGTTYAYTDDPETALAVLLGKKALDVSKTTRFRTQGGKGLMSVGRSGLIDPALRRGLINSQRENERKD